MKYVPLASTGIKAIVDDEDFEKAMQYSWQLSKRKTVSYASAYKKGAGRTRGNKMYLHQFIMGFPPQVDHVNGDGLDCRKTNLRECTTSENRHNSKKTERGSSVYKGASYHKAAKSWRAVIGVNGRTKQIGGFKTEIEAAQAYDRMAQIYHGPFAKFNFPEMIAASSPTIPIPTYGAVIRNNEIAWPDKKNATQFLAELLRMLK